MMETMDDFDSDRRYLILFMWKFELSSCCPIKEFILLFFRMLSDLDVKSRSPWRICANSSAHHNILCPLIAVITMDSFYWSVWDLDLDVTLTMLTCGAVGLYVCQRGTVCRRWELWLGITYMYKFCGQRALVNCESIFYLFVHRILFFNVFKQFLI